MPVRWWPTQQAPTDTSCPHRAQKFLGAAYHYIWAHPGRLSCMASGGTIGETEHQLADSHVGGTACSTTWGKANLAKSLREIRVIGIPAVCSDLPQVKHLRPAHSTPEIRPAAGRDHYRDQYLTVADVESDTPSTVVRSPRSCQMMVSPSSIRCSRRGTPWPRRRWTVMRTY
jgi:hypothetical protein